MADQIFINIYKLLLLIFKYKGDCIIYILFCDRIASSGKFYKLVQDPLHLLCRCTLPHDLGRSIAGDQRYMKCPFQFLYIYIKLTKYICLVFSRDFNHQF